MAWWATIVNPVVVIILGEIMARKSKTTDNTKKDKLDLADLASTVGGEILSRMDSVRTWVDTGNLALNYTCSGKFIGGGIPIGKLIEIWGNSSSCKTLFAMNFLRGIQKLGGIAVFVDVENTINATFAEKAAHVDTDGVLVIPVEKADSLEKAFNQIHVVLREIGKSYGNERPVMIIYDSLAASASEREFAETKIDMINSSDAAIKAAGAGADKPGEHAKIIGKELRKLNPVLAKANASIVFINQIREKIGTVSRNNEKKASGGRSLEYYCSLCLKTRAWVKLKDERGNIKGILVNVENTKNKCFKPFIAAPSNAALLFDAGINPLGGLLDCLYKNYRIDKTSPARWKVRPEYSNGEDVNFQGSLEKNVVPMEILLKCPKLIDAENEEQVRSYFESLGSAMNDSEYQEQSVESGEELDVELAG